MSLAVHLALVFTRFHCCGRHDHGLRPSWFVADMVQVHEYLGGTETLGPGTETLGASREKSRRFRS